VNNAEVVQDFRRRWEGTFVWLAIEGRGEELVRLESIENSSTKVATLNLSSDRIGKLSLNLGSEGHSLQFRYPPVGVFQHERDSYVFYRRPQRQYRRGICGDNSIMRNTTRNYVGNRSRWDFAEVRSAFAHETYSVPTALTLLETGYKGVALNDNFSLVQSMFENTDYVLFHWEHVIARVNEKGVVTKLFETLYKDMIQELGFKHG
jgi:hypothetical protein